MIIKITGTEALAKKLYKKSNIQFNAVCMKTLTELFNRAKNGGTPVGQYKGGGQLRISANIIRPGGSGFGGEMGYTKEYAPHVEYGHRTVNGGYVQGQHFLRDNAEIQRPIFRQDLIDAIRKE